jgi:rhodanese-related sulfurtransferase
MYEFTLDSTMKEVETKFPFARAMLHAKFHVGGCASCGYESQETVAQVANKHGKDADKMIEALNSGLLDMGAAEVSPEAASKLLEDSSVLLVDVRENWEFELCKINERAVQLTEKTMPLIFEQGLHAKAVIVYCHHGVRSLNAALYMRQNGLPNAVSLKGGIDRYAQSIDSSIPRY